MDKAKALDILRTHNEWRRGADISMQDPKELGEAIDIAISVLEQDLALTWEDVRTILDKENDILHECNDNAQQVIEVYPKEEDYYGEILKRFNEQREKK